MSSMTADRKPVCANNFDKPLLPGKMVDFSQLGDQIRIALTPLDGRYREQTAVLANYLSEAGLNRARLFVEIEWLIFLSSEQLLPGVTKLSPAQVFYLRRAVTEFAAPQIKRLAELEADTRHDVKAVEYFLKEYLAAAVKVARSSSEQPTYPTVAGDLTVQLTREEAQQLDRYQEVVHLFCTSEDINNLSYALCIHDAISQIWWPQAQGLLSELQDWATLGAEVPMLARTHGQPATPVTIGRELAVFKARLERQLNRLASSEFNGKFNGATGTWAAHRVALPDVDWPKVTAKFIRGLGLIPNGVTTQIEPHDWQVELYSHLTHAGSVLHNLATDCWTYISLGYFHQKLSAQGSTGSSTMPHKVNPIRFENAEANLEISQALFGSLMMTLPTSRMQRDLTDSSAQRNIGVALGHSLLAIKNLRAGLRGLEIAPRVLAADLEQNWEVLGEAIQQTMRVAGLAGVPGMEKPYERLKELTRDARITPEALREFIEKLGLPSATAQRLLDLTPDSYLGYSAQIARSGNQLVANVDAD